MAHKRLFIYAALLAICYLVGVTWAETATQTLPISSSNTNNNASQPIAAVKSVPAAAAPPPVIAPTIAAPKVISSTVASGSKSGNSSTTECACAGALLPQVDANGKELPICAECKCAHVARNTTLIKVVVIIVIWIISILVIYMLFLMCLEPLLNKRVKANNYQEHTNEDVQLRSIRYSGIKYSRLAANPAIGDISHDDDDDDNDIDHDDDDDDEQLVGNKEAHNF
ncbi:uncharacterized protein CG1161 isoform X1 [Drosophila grimshawi]|uniref:uncharacterized protein CG1161 isoform X1 n=1 Tax=Drosophila grimshawi TaxID=7222 RepID=UPI0013EEF71E|nr:uncharacterized protein CG1161 isoform X1 [Drosophila grimshawi]